MTDALSEGDAAELQWQLPEYTVVPPQKSGKDECEKEPRHNVILLAPESPRWCFNSKSQTILNLYAVEYHINQRKAENVHNYEAQIRSWHRSPCLKNDSDESVIQIKSSWKNLLARSAAAWLCLITLSSACNTRRALSYAWHTHSAVCHR